MIMKSNCYISVLLLLLTSFFSCNNKKTPAPEEQKDTLKLISFNIRYDNPLDGEHRWENRRDACARMIDTYLPDAFGVQEALVNQLEELDLLLPDYTWVGEGRNPGMESNEHTAIFFRKNKFMLTGSNTFWLSETPDTISRGWDARYNRTATWVKLYNQETGKEFVFMNTHLDHKGQIARSESTKLIVEKLRAISGDSIPVFVAGDFNALPSDTLFIPLKKWLKDTRMEIAPADSTQTTNGWGNEPPHKVIDYLFFQGANPLGYKVITENFGVPYISDHYPIEGIYIY